MKNEPPILNAGDAYINSHIIAMSGVFLEQRQAVKFDFGLLILIKLIQSLVLHESLVVSTLQVAATNVTELFDSMAGYYVGSYLKDVIKTVTVEPNFEIKEDIKNHLVKEDIQDLKSLNDEERLSHLDFIANTIQRYHYASSLGVSFICDFSSFNNDSVASYFSNTLNKYSTFSENILHDISAVVNEETRAINSLLPEARFTLDVPLIFNCVLDKCTSRKDIIATAIEVRDSKEAQAFRRQLALFDQALGVGDDKVLVELAKEMRDKINQLAKKIDQPSIGLQIQFPWAIGVDPFGLFKLFKSRRKRHLIFVDQLYAAGLRARSGNSIGKLF